MKLDKLRDWFEMQASASRFAQRVKARSLAKGLLYFLLAAWFLVLACMAC